MKAYLEIEMPASCGSCLFRRLWPEDDEVECIIEKTLWTKDAEKNPACPLVPVPTHGLIAREQILDAIRLELAQADACNDMEDYDSWMRVFDYVRKFPTFIPADKPKEEPS